MRSTGSEVTKNMARVKKSKIFLVQASLLVLLRRKIKDFFYGCCNPEDSVPFRAKLGLGKQALLPASKAPPNYTRKEVYFNKGDIA
jgi:hypothetical protein